MTDTTSNGPACTFDPAILRAWLAQPAGVHTDDDDGDGSRTYDMAEGIGVDAVDTMVTAAVVSTLDSLLEILRNDEEQDALAARDGVDRIGIIRVYDGDGGCDGVVVTVDLDNGVRLAGVEQDHKLITGGHEGPIDAIVAAVATVAEQANRVVATFNRATGADAEVTGRELFVVLPDDGVDEHLAGLAHSLCQKPETLPVRKRHIEDGEPGQTREMTSRNGVLLDWQYDIDSAIAYAAHHGLRYIEERETVADSASGAQ